MLLCGEGGLRRSENLFLLNTIKQELLSDSIEPFKEYQDSSPTFGSSPTPIPLSLHQVISLSESSCMSPFELTDRKGGRRAGEEPNQTTARKPGPL
jgi:hypothetical protein